MVSSEPMLTTRHLETPVAVGPRPIAQYSKAGALAVWAAAALPMAALAWLVAPALARRIDGPEPFFQALSICMTVGLIWQFVLVVTLLWREQRSLRWRVVREVLWLKAPSTTDTGRPSHRLWLMLIPFAALFYLESLIPGPGTPATRDLGAFLASDAAEQFFQGSWGWFALVVTSAVFNTVLGEELLFRGWLLPRMSRSFGKLDWLANGVLFATYHLHMPWVIPAALLDSVSLVYPSRRYRSAWMGIAVHSTQSVFIILIVLGLVL